MSVRDSLQQNLEEFSRFLDLVEGTSVLEIGSRAGNSLKLMAYKLPKFSTIVSVDNGFDPSFASHRMEPDLRANLEPLDEEYDVHILIGDSHDRDMIYKVKDLGPFDTVFIDGDHSTAGCMMDWLNYGPMGKMVAFHDILLPSVRTVWDEAKQSGRNLEIIRSKDMGIGVVWPSTSRS